ncbi:hypothetical protein Btru_066384 [Bulinus truncatus]|nr:hypothetical protein Btru_066384 [Bulinus truncatus]
MAENGQLAEEYHPQRTPAPSPEKMTDRSSFFTINLKLLPVKLFYFFFMAAVGVLLPFIALYMMFLGLSSRETGIIYGTMPFIGFFIRPLIGALADKFKKHKLTLMIVTCLTGVFYFLLIIVPGRSPSSYVQLSTSFKCNNEDSYVFDCTNPGNSPSCHSGLTSFDKYFRSDPSNQSLSCNFSCSVSSYADTSQFKACFTDDVGSYNPSSCYGTLINGKHLNFTIPNLAALIKKNRTDDLVDDRHCYSYDVKNVQYEINYIHSAFQILCNVETDLNCNVLCPKPSNCTSVQSSYDKTFYLFFFIFLLANIAFAPIFPILDAAAYEALGDKPNHWGIQRAFGTLGFSLFGVTAMFIRQGNTQDFDISFYIFLPLCIISTLIAFFLPISSDIKCGQFVQNVCKLLSYGEVSAFLFVVMYFGLLTGALETFLFIYLFDIGGNSFVVGVVLLVLCCSELPMLFVAGKIIKKFGLVNCLYLTLVCYAVRFLVFSIIKNPWLVLVAEPLYGICFGLMYAAASSYANIIAPPGMSATMQGLLGGVHFGFGKGIGSIITGFMFDSIGARWTWGCYSLISVSVLFMYVLLNKFVFTSCRHHPPSTVNKSGPTVLKISSLPDEQSRQKENLIKVQNEVVET